MRKVVEWLCIGIMVVGGALLVAVLLTSCARSARASVPPQVELRATWSSRAGAELEASAAVIPLARFLSLHLDAGVRASRAGLEPGEAGPPRREGISPSRLGAGLVLRLPWAWGHLLAALDVGAADCQYVAYGRGRLALALTPYVRLEGAAALFAEAGAPRAYQFGLVVVPYLRFVELGWACHSEDACGLGGGFALLLRRVELRLGALATFHDFSGRVPVGARVFTDLALFY